MKFQLKIGAAVAALALTVSPAALAMGKPEGSPPYGQGSEGKPTPGPKAGLPAKAKAYGRYCKDESRKRDGEGKGTPFSRCVTNVAQATAHTKMAPGRVCKDVARKRDDKAQKGTPFSRCVRDVVKLRHEERKEAREKRREEREEKAGSEAS